MKRPMLPMVTMMFVLAAGPARATIITNLNENFTTLAGWTTYGSPPFTLITDSGRSVGYSSDTAGNQSIINRADFTPVNVSLGPLSLLVDQKEVYAPGGQYDGLAATFNLYHKTGDPIVAGELQKVIFFQRGYGWFQLQVYEYTDGLGNTAAVVNQTANPGVAFPTSYFTLSVVRDPSGTWTVRRSDLGTPILTATESTVATGGLLGVFEMRAYGDVNGPGQYFDNLTISETIPEPAAVVLLVLGGLIAWRAGRRNG